MKEVTGAFRVIYEDNHLLVVNKAPGILVQGDKTGDIPLVELAKGYIKEKYQKPGAVFLGVVHRIDRPVSGIVVLARTSKALARMNEIFRERETRKTYWAIVKNKPPVTQGKLTHWLVKNERRNKASVFDHESKGAQYAELDYRILTHRENHYLLEVTPVTGRPHQIRAQLASMGCPIKGDVKYGFPHPNSDGSICLHARKLQFLHPVKKEMLVLEAPLPEYNFWKHFVPLEEQ